MNFQNFISVRRGLHQIPEVGFKEWKTQAFLLNVIDSLPKERIEIEKWETGIFVLVKGINPKKTIGFRTDMDGLPIEEKTNLSFSSQHFGYMHACGHDFHMSIALGILTYFTQHPVEDDLLFIFQPAEEGPGGAKLMRNSNYFKKHKPEILFALHIAPELPVGVVSTKTGILFANSSEIKVVISGIKGHAAFPHLANDAIVTTSHFITQVQTILSRNINPMDSGVITFGKMHAGSANNIISDFSELHGTIRSLSKTSMEQMQTRIREISKGTAYSFNCKVDVQFPDPYVQVDNSEIETNSFISFVKRSENARFLESTIAMTAEDFGYFLEVTNGFMFWLGVNSKSGLHTSELNPDENAIPFAIRLCIDYIKTL